MKTLLESRRMPKQHDIGPPWPIGRLFWVRLAGRARLGVPATAFTGNMLRKRTLFLFLIIIFKIQ